MEGITASQRLEGVAELAKQRPETEEATWRLLGALSFMSPEHAIPYSVFQPAPSSPSSPRKSDNSNTTVSGTAASPTSSPTKTKRDASGTKTRTRNRLNDRKMLQDPLPWVVTTSEPNAPNIQQTSTETTNRARSSTTAPRNLFEEALQALLETAIVRRSHVRGPIIHIDAATQTLYRHQTIKRHGQRDFDLAVRMLLQATPPTPSSAIAPSSPPTGPDGDQALLANHAGMLVCFFWHYAYGPIVDVSSAATAENKKKKDEMDHMFVKPPRFVTTRELEQLTKRTTGSSGYREPMRRLPLLRMTEEALVEDAGG
ncbi:hypothetical protein PG993_011196 [Apiospora rasikravindrae]|uniref:Uncharacterized protein n=1 Tax=Apiospora rasikravindrae TaxID=990691 RepID=A0ABR1SDK9_9PEZI